MGVGAAIVVNEPQPGAVDPPDPDEVAEIDGPVAVGDNPARGMRAGCGGDEAEQRGDEKR